MWMQAKAFREPSAPAWAAANSQPAVFQLPPVVLQAQEPVRATAEVFRVIRLFPTLFLYPSTHPSFIHSPNITFAHRSQSVQFQPVSSLFPWCTRLLLAGRLPRWLSGSGLLFFCTSPGPRHAGSDLLVETVPRASTELANQLTS